MTPDEEMRALNAQIDLLNRTISDIMRERRKAEQRIQEIRFPPPTTQMLRLAGRHISDVVMYQGHSVTESDIAALRKVIDYMAAHLNTPDEEHT